MSLLIAAMCIDVDFSFVIQTNDGGGGKHPHFVLDRKADQEELWLMPGELLAPSPERFHHYPVPSKILD